MPTIGSFLSGVGRGIMAFTGFGGSPYNAGRHDMPETAGYSPRPIHAESRWADGIETILGRVDDSDRNDGLIIGGLDRDVESTIGPGLRPWPTPIYQAINRDYKWGAAFGEKLISRYRVWAEDVLNRTDAQMLMSHGEQQGMAYLGYRRTGECLFEIRKDERGASNPTNILLIDPRRIANPISKSNGNPNFKNGIEYLNGVPIRAWIRPFHPDDKRTDKGLNEPIPVAFKTSTGMPKLILISNKRFVEQVRGVSPLTGSLTEAKNLNSFQKDVANRARLEAQMGVFIHSDASPEEVAEIVAPGSGPVSNSLTELWDWRQKNPIASIAGLFTRHLVGKEKVTTLPPVTPGSNYPEYRRSKMADISTPLGWVSSEISQDYDGINLSILRSIENRRHRTVLHRREVWSRNFNTPIFIAWMEEEVKSGAIKIPGGPENFYKNVTALVNATWIGPGRGVIDPVKEETGRNLKEASNRASPIAHILEDNQYPSEIYDQIALARAMQKDRDIAAPNYNTKAQSAGEEDSGGEGGTGGNPADRDNDGIANEADKKKNKPKQGISA